MVRTISYKGKTVKTEIYKEISDYEYNQIVNEYYAKPDFSEVQKQFISLSTGGVSNNEITNYYVKDLMSKTLIHYNKWSVEDVLEYKPLVEHFMGKVFENKKVFPDTMSNCEKLETAFRLGGKGIAGKPANFPLKTIDEILSNYNINNNWHDFSCGWGARLIGALKNNVNYFGTDPNYLLTERLQQMAKDYKETLRFNQSSVDIKTQGSEIFIEDWENKIGLAFSSPPYFCLEDYKVGNQSYKEGTTYEKWKSDYLKPTFENIFRYLIKSGFFLLNINDFKNYNLVADSIDIAKSVGFKLVNEHKLENIQRCYGVKGLNNVKFNDNSERILVFVRNDYEQDERLKNVVSGEYKAKGIGSQMNIFDYI